MKAPPWLSAGKISGNFIEERKDWLLPPKYLDNNNVKDMTSVTSPKPPIKEEPKTEEQSFTSQKQRSVNGDQTAPVARIKKKKKKIGIAITKISCKHSPNRRFRWPKQGAPRL